MTAVPVDVSRAILEREVSDSQAWAARHGWLLELPPSGLALRLRMIHPVDHGPLLLHGDFDGYRAVPPAWIFLDPDNGTVTAHAWPSAGTVGGQASIFHSVGIICAHFSRNAYVVQGGPHDWGGLAQWADVQEGVHAENVGEMLAVIATHLRYSPGRMG